VDLRSRRGEVEALSFQSQILLVPAR